MKRSILLYMRMSRPSQLVAVFLVYAWGSMVAGVLEGGSDTGSFLAGLAPLLLVSASIHYTNEYADHETDALTVRTPFSGGSGALSDYNARPILAFRAAWATLLVGLSLAIFLLLAGVLLPVALSILVIGAAGGWMYSLPPLALAWRGWGELDNALLGGVLLPVYGYTVQSSSPDLSIILLSLPFALLVLNNLLATTWADREADGRVGKFTLATRWPVARLRVLYFLVLLTAYILLLALGGWLLPYAILLPSIALAPLSLAAGWTYTRWHSPMPSVRVMVLFILLQLTGWAAFYFAQMI